MSAIGTKLGVPLVHAVALIAVVGALLLITVRFADQPFVWRYDHPSAHNSTNAINHLSYGLAVTKGALVRNANPTPPEHLLISSHHPPLLSLIVAGSYAVFGVQEAAARGVVIAFSVLNVLLLYWAVRLLVGRSTALASALIFALLPLQIVYSTKVNFEPLVLTFVLATLVAYGYWLRKPGTARFLVLAAVFCIGTTSDWAAYYIGGILPAFHFALLWYRRRPIARSDWMLWLLPPLGVLMFGLFVAHLYWVEPGLVGGLADLAAERGGVHDEYGYGEEGFSNLSLVQRTVSRSALLFTLPVLALGIVGLMLALARITGGERGKHEDAAYLLLFWVLGLAHFVVFRHVSWVHEFLVYHLMVPVAVSAGWLAIHALRALPRRVALAAALIFAAAFIPLSLLQARHMFWDGQIAAILDLSRFLEREVPEGAVVFTTATHHPFVHPAVPHYARRDVVNGVETVGKLQGLLRRWPNSPHYFLAYEAPSADPERTAELIEKLSSRHPGVLTSWGTLYRLPPALHSLDEPPPEN